MALIWTTTGLRAVDPSFFSSVWKLGSDDGETHPFSSENYSANAAPGSASSKDDDYYLAGSYPGAIGELTADEPIANFERSISELDPRTRIHFPLTAAERGPSSMLALTVDLFKGGAWIGFNQAGFQSHDVTISMNGVSLGSWTAIHDDKTIKLQFPAQRVGAQAENNVLTVEHTGGAPGGYIRFDYLKLEADADGLADADRDGLPKWFEDQYGLNDGDGADAISDRDGDGLNALQEHALETNPTDPDSDNDGLSDGAETTTHPLNADSDGDGLRDGEETTTNPAIADHDLDKFPDGYEVAMGTNPADGSSTPFPFAGSIGVQFLTEDDHAQPLGAWEPAGVIPAPHWNPTPRLPSWTPDDNPLGIFMSGLTDSLGKASTATITLTYDQANSGYHIGTGDERLLASMVQTDSHSDGKLPVVVELTGIPYAVYDIIMHVGHRYSGNHGYTQRGADPTSRRFFISNTQPPFLGWSEITATTAAAAAPGSHVRYRGLSGGSQTVSLHQVGEHEVGLHGIQIIDTASDADRDGMPDAIEIEFGLDPSLDDAAEDADLDGLGNLAEIIAGTDPLNRDSDGDGLMDGDETTTDPLNPDCDGDGLADGREVHGRPFPSDPLLVDSDNDGHDDPLELNLGSDPMDPNSKPPPVPTWNGSSRTWQWRIDDLSILWNHRQSLLPGAQGAIAEAAVELDGGGYASSLRMALYQVDGVLTCRFSCNQGIFYENGDPNDGIWFRGPTDPQDDLKSALGLSGHGEMDDSHPLRFEFIANQPTAGKNLWNISFNIYSVADRLNPRLVASHSQNGIAAADPRLLDGTAPWTNTDGVPDVPSLQGSSGLGMFITRQALAPADDDNDSMPNAWESRYSLDIHDPADAEQDPDLDGVINREEHLAGTNPHDADSDADGVKDGVELRHGSSPTSSASMPVWHDYTGPLDDLNGDGVSDAWVIWAGGRRRDPGADDDFDGMTNLEESQAGTDPDDPQSRIRLSCTKRGRELALSWPDNRWKSQTIEISESLGNWSPAAKQTAPLDEGWRSFTAAIDFDRRYQFYRLWVMPMDTDGDAVEDWIEHEFLFSSITDANSTSQPMERDHLPDLSGDARTLIEKLSVGSYPGTDPETDPASPSGATSQADGQPSPMQAARFLMQASFGPTLEDIGQVRKLGYEAWIDRQLAMPASTLSPYIREIKRDAANGRLDPYYDYNETGGFVSGYNVTTPWARHAIGAEDQLRQRVAFALSQMLVVSRRDAQLDNKPEAIANYYDLLIEHALGDYGELLLGVAMHPTMGWYLSHVGNQKPDPDIQRFPDENFARELMQLFSIGLWELNPDGSRKLDANHNPVATYDNAVIGEMARVFTGLYFDSPYGWGSGGWADGHYTKPMRMYPQHHDFGTKHLLNGLVIPERGASMENGLQDIKDAVDSVVRHPNTAPFVCKKLIQFLVTANPTPEYVARISTVFNDDGSGRHGNLGAVVKAILLDPEARAVPTSLAYGKVREPVVRTMHLGRLFHVLKINPRFVWRNPEDTYSAHSFQEPTAAPNVFNFFTHEYQAPGAIRDAGLVSPVFQIIDSYSSISFPNILWQYLDEGFYSGYDYHFPMDYSDFLLVADDAPALLDRVNLLLCAGNMSAATRTSLRNALTTPGLTLQDKVAVAVWVTINSPEGAIQR